MAVITSEQFVAAVSSQRDGDLFRAKQLTRYVGICDESANGSSYIDNNNGMTSRVSLTVT
jgi:hypothetical protein